jgi:signal transduction histidine kinase/ABC-type multidrug transport system ATPase subunit
MTTASLQASPSGPRLAPPLLQLRGLVLSFGNLRVLNGVDFEVAPGQLVALTGENGAGKSTVVRCIAGDINPDAGEVLIEGVRVRSHPNAASSGVAVVWQDLAFCNNLDVAANFFLGKERSPWLVSDRRASRATKSILSSYGIHVDVTRPVDSLSSGQRQLVAVAKAMQGRPRLLVLDEPTALLGVQETRQIEDLIAKLKALGTTILLVSHDVEQVFNLADRILVLRRGRVAADLTPAETHPDDVVAIMSGHAPDVTARRQLSRLQNLVDQLASAKLKSSLPLIVSALGAALRAEQLCIHLVEDGSLRCVASTGFPPAVLDAWATVPVGSSGGPMGMAAATGRTVIDEDVDKSSAWTQFSSLCAAAGIHSSWSVPLISSRGLIGVLTGCQPLVGRPHRDQMELVSLYAGYAAGAIERDQLFGEVTARNRVLETIREVLETLAGPEPVSRGLLSALQSLQRGLQAAEIELWVRPSGGSTRCVAFIDTNNQSHPEPAGRDESDAVRAFRVATRLGRPCPLGHGVTGQVVVTTLGAPGGRAVLIARWHVADLPDDALALLADGANSVRLALEREEAEQAHRRAAALLHSQQLQRDFLSRLSHELRTPLTAIRGYASSMLAADVTWDDESKTRFLDRIAGESARLGRLVGDLLDFSAIESDLLRLEPDWCDLSLIIEAAVACLPAEQAQAVSISCPPEIGPVWGDHDRLEQVFVNLIENAFCHNAPGIEVKVQAWLARPDRVAIRVLDNGKGIPSPLRSHLFEPWARDGTSPRGAGLGLSIVMGIVQAHGGHISLEEIENGACFLMLLPAEGPAETLT